MRAKGSDELLLDSSDPVLDSLADEITQVAADGAQNGFKAEHFRRCAGIVRMFDARLEEKGTNREFNSKLEDDDYYKLNPPLAAQNAADYWSKHGVYLNKNDLAAQLTMDSTAYREMKKSIKRQGGIRVLHASIADALERKAKEYETVAFKGGAVIQNNRVVFLSPDRPRAQFMTVQYESMLYFGSSNLDCLCRAMTVEGALLAIACLAGCAPCCAPAAFILALEKLMEGLNLCQPGRC